MIKNEKNINKFKQYTKENQCTHMCTVGTKGLKTLAVYKYILGINENCTQRGLSFSALLGNNKVVLQLFVENESLLDLILHCYIRMSLN